MLLLHWRWLLLLLLAAESVGDARSAAAMLRIPLQIRMFRHPESTARATAIVEVLRAIDPERFPQLSAHPLLLLRLGERPLPALRGKDLLEFRFLLELNVKRPHEISCPRDRTIQNIALVGGFVLFLGRDAKADGAGAGSCSTAAAGGEEGIGGRWAATGGREVGGQRRIVGQVFADFFVLETVHGHEV